MTLTAPEQSAPPAPPATEYRDPRAYVKPEVGVAKEVGESQVEGGGRAEASGGDALAGEAEKNIRQASLSLFRPGAEGLLQGHRLGIEDVDAVGAVTADGPLEDHVLFADHDGRQHQMHVITYRRRQDGGASDRMLERHEKAGLARPAGAADDGGRLIEAIRRLGGGGGDRQGEESQVGGHQIFVRKGLSTASGRRS
ncbi:hypothetical protein [Streptomyces sp. CB02009]|uniref:hypothetical protein n=1 Tax=Streptomyces sp. CB02009 TaxID=1703938 RepID=UPI00116105BA|nr:hypothetical protein [Streptomyces sp. CB02009]